MCSLGTYQRIIHQEEKSHPIVKHSKGREKVLVTRHYGIGHFRVAVSLIMKVRLDAKLMNEN